MLRNHAKVNEKKYAMYKKLTSTTRSSSSRQELKKSLRMRILKKSFCEEYKSN